MNELSLFTGAGGGILGTHLLGWRPVGYVEWNDYCQRVLAARIADGFIPEAPIFTDVREFARSGAAAEYRGVADVVTAGFPCQPFSVAGKQLAADDERNMWPATAEVLRIVQPRSVLLENVPGLVSCGYIGTVLADLAALGYVGRWGVLGACDAGAPHKRYRLWVLAHRNGERRGAGRPRRPDCEGTDGENFASQGLADATRKRRGEARRDRERPSQRITGGREALADANGKFPRHAAKNIPPREFESSSFSEAVAYADISQREGMQRAIGVQSEHANPCIHGEWWRRDPADSPESGLGRVAPRMADTVDRLTAIGNGQVPAVVALAWRTLNA